MWLIANAKNGVSSCEVAQSLGVTQKTAWLMLHRVRLAWTLTDAERFDRTLSQVVGEPLAYSELTGKDLVLA